jgi:hypothetical protein
LSFHGLLRPLHESALMGADAHTIIPLIFGALQALIIATLVDAKFYKE